MRQVLVDITRVRHAAKRTGRQVTFHETRHFFRESHGPVTHHKGVKVLAISGSLRAQSSNTTLLEAAKLVAAPPAEIVLYSELATIPPFNPDWDVEPGPEPVLRLRAAVRDSAVVLFSTPEYAHGVPGALKNALDWMVGSGELSGKPVALFNASARGQYAQASLREILRTMDADVLADAELTLPLLGKPMDAAQLAALPEFRTMILSSIARALSDLPKA